MRLGWIGLAATATVLAGCASADDDTASYAVHAGPPGVMRGCSQAGGCGGGVDRRQYYDENAGRYYFYDPRTRRYYWENGAPRR